MEGGVSGGSQSFVRTQGFEPVSKTGVPLRGCWNDGCACKMVGGLVKACDFTFHLGCPMGTMRLHTSGIVSHTGTDPKLAKFELEMLPLRHWLLCPFSLNDIYT